MWMVKIMQAIMQAIHVALFDNIMTTKDINLLVPALQCRSCHIAYYKLGT